MKTRRKRFGYLIVGALLGVALFMLYSGYQTAQDISRLGEAERKTYCKIWQSENVEACLKGE